MNGTPNGAGHRPWTYAALGTCAVGVLGSLWLSLGMDLKACPLCLYQRAFLMSGLAVLLIGALSDLRRSSLVPLLALGPLAAGLSVAGFHVYLESSGTLECPAGVLGAGTAPQQSLLAFVVAGLLVVVPLVRSRSNRMLPAAGVAVIGVALAVGAIASAPPLPPAPSAPYSESLDGCRPAYRASA